MAKTVYPKSLLTIEQCKKYNTELMEICKLQSTEANDEIKKRIEADSNFGIFIGYSGEGTYVLNKCLDTTVSRYQSILATKKK